MSAALAFGFPLLALIAWQLIVDAGILNPLWFPQPTKIAKALWDRDGQLRPLLAKRACSAGRG